MNFRNVCKNLFILAILFVSVGTASASCPNEFRPNVNYDYSLKHFQDQFNLCSEISDNYDYYDVLVISDTGNFEGCNQAVLVHFLKNGKLEILDTGKTVNTDQMKTRYTTLKELNSKYELHFFITNPDKKEFMPIEFDNSGALKNNAELTYENFLSGVFKQSKVNDFQEQHKKVEMLKHKRV